MAPPPATERLYLEEPRRKTALATVTGHASGGFLLDRTVFHAPLRGYHHDQPCDRGHVLAEGHKLKIDKVLWDDRGRLVHRTSGPLPPVGAKAQLHLDAPRRDLQARAHAAAHLLAAALVEQRAELLAPPRVVGGGEARLLARFRPADLAHATPRELAARAVARAQQMADARVPVEARWATRDDAARHVAPHAPPLDDVMPGEPTLRLVRMGDACTMPCDAPLPENTREVGRLQLTLVQANRDGARVGARVG